MNRKFSENDYKEYLHGLIPSIWKLLPLYEEKNEYILDFIDSLLNFELYGVCEAIEDLPKNLWYTKVVATLEGIEKQLQGDFIDSSCIKNHKKFKREVFKMVGLVNKQLKQLEEGEEHGKI